MSIQPVDVQPSYPAQKKAAESLPLPPGRSYQQSGAQAGADSIDLNAEIPALPRFDKMQSDKSTRNEVAASIKNADSTMVEIGTKIDSMKENLEIIVKNFPPYPPGSNERINFLRNFNSLRQQIDALTIPRPNETSDIALKLQGLGTGKGGLNIPALADSVPEATDPQIHQAIGNLDRARKTLDAGRAALAGEAATLIANAASR
ncbi:MAG: hypothetical protein PHH91_01050 [Desulfuromonadaceae bacterium]|nr:hypothetical protein [Desulfuromonadaceae bacterium]